MRRFQKTLFAVAALLAAALSSCTKLPPELAGAQFGGAAPEIHKNEDGKNVELVLHPVPVWDEQRTAAPQKVKIDGQEIFVRVRSNEILDRTYARAGLFWHSRKEEIFVPVVVLGPPVEIRKLAVRAGGNYAELRRAENFKFTPAQSRWEPKKISSAAFEMKPSTLRAIVAEKTARLTIKTNRGDLHLGLDVVAGASEKEVRGNARRMFAQFSGKMEEVKKQ